jgi:hypothetical protein
MRCVSESRLEQGSDAGSLVFIESVRSMARDDPHGRIEAAATRFDVPNRFSSLSCFIFPAIKRECPAAFIAGVAYVKYDRASSAALAIESLHEVTLNDGHGPRLKVMLAESPHTRCVC